MTFREPLIWFLLIGAVLFGVESWRSGSPDTIVVDEGVKNRISSLWQLQMGRAPTDIELNNLTTAWVREEIFYREAVRLGLDEDDTIIRRRLVQKLGFLVQDVSDEVVSAEEVEAFYQENIADYTQPERYTFSQVFLKDESRSPEVASALAEGQDWRELGDPTLLQRTYVAKSERDILSALGAEFVAELPGFVEGEWAGPFKSSFGYHMVRLERVAAEEATPLPFIERRVMADLQQQRTKAAMDEYYQNLAEQYPVEYR